MYSVKPGRGPSLMGGAGGIVAVIFGVIWTVGAASSGAPGFFVLFGVIFIIMAIAGVIYNFYNATRKNRMSTFDITEEIEESDPIARAMGHAPHSTHKIQAEDTKPRKYEGSFCPFCGARVTPEFDYCPKCGRDI